ncbi:NlpC/P60 family protein [Aestuariibius sp. HNIBRBA575]|uniref:C40 family peptidase n=1 Tax=Aestuariibius sp. HNIBRBA575 TaxID=3233343 RepID=UPI0034A31775
MTDSRLLAANARFAASELQGQVDAPHFIEGDMCRIVTDLADLRCDPAQTGLDRQLVHGDRFRVLERINGQAFGQSDRGGYVGYVPDYALGLWIDPTDQVQVRATFAFDRPDFKAPKPIVLTYGARIHAQGTEGRFTRTLDGHYIPSHHLAPLSDPPIDPVSEAEKLLGTPYLWGGNSSAGIDCSGLVQAAFIACGLDCPGDSDLQQDMFGTEFGEGIPLMRGDLLFWKGHVAMVVDEHRLIHANAFHMAVEFEDVAQAIARIAAQGDGHITARKRVTLPLG